MEAARSLPTRSMRSKRSTTNSKPVARLGETLPRIYTLPLVTGAPGGCPCGCALTPETSFGFELIDFARDVVGIEFDPWQKFLSIHIGELLDGRPRFHTVLILVARQNGKTTWAMVLVLYWLFLERLPLVLGTSTDRSYAKRTWRTVVDMAESNEWLRKRIGPKSVRKSIGEETFITLKQAEYTFAANNGRAGRSMTVHRWLCDEVREHTDMDCWESVDGAMSAVRDAQKICISNQGDDTAVVLDSLYGPAKEFIDTGEGDERLGLFEWSAPPGAEPDDVDALAAANPAMGLPGGHGRQTAEDLRMKGWKAKRAGGQELAAFRTNYMCQRVTLLDPAIEPEAWDNAGAENIPDLMQHTDKLALCLDISMGQDHAALVGAAVIDGKVYIDVVKAWSGVGCTKLVRDELPGIVRTIAPRVYGWDPKGPAAHLAADMQENKPAHWPPRRTVIQAFGTETAGACMALAELVKTGEVVHGSDPMLNAHIYNAQRKRFGDRWVFERRGTGPVNGAYAAAGAVQLARTLPAPRPAIELL